VKFSSRLPLSLLIAFSAAVLGAAETTELKPSVPLEPWSLENVEILPSPKVTWGHLENGLRYAIMPHATPPGRVSMRLLVTAGSLNENDDERGYAHFVEHMAFNGTKHFPAGELVKFLQRQGAVFGPDIGAFTSHTHTLYKLDMPDNSTGTFETGLRVLRDFADGILFEPAEVKRERGVILSEERSNHTLAATTRLALTDFLYKGTRIPDRDPIGLIPTIEHASSPALQKFYQRWYRPENMCVVIVGQIDAKHAEALVRSEFASLVPSGPAPIPAPVGNIELASEPLVGTSLRQQSGFHITLFKVSPWREKPSLGEPNWKDCVSWRRSPCLNAACMN
jgi:zinc protease